MVQQLPDDAGKRRWRKTTFPLRLQLTDSSLRRIPRFHRGMAQSVPPLYAPGEARSPRSDLPSLTKTSLRPATRQETAANPQTEDLIARRAPPDCTNIHPTAPSAVPY
jgi:hypothetical protein